jgi:hypothetical protein
MAMLQPSRDARMPWGSGHATRGLWMTAQTLPRRGSAGIRAELHLFDYLVVVHDRIKAYKGTDGLRFYDRPGRIGASECRDGAHIPPACEHEVLDLVRHAPTQ